MNQKELKDLIEFLIEKDIAEFELERGDVRIKVVRSGKLSAKDGAKKMQSEFEKQYKEFFS